MIGFKKIALLVLIVLLSVHFSFGQESGLGPNENLSFGLLSLLPTLLVVILAILTKRTFESLVGGTVLGFLILHKGNFFSEFVQTLLAVFEDEVIGWIILVCGLFGSLIHLLVKSGGAKAFANYLLRYVKSRKSALLVTWLLGLMIFIDDYLNALTVGSTMKKVTDKFRVPREMLAYIVDSTAAPICVLIPISTWALYISGLLVKEGLANEGMGVVAYYSVIPFVVYGWVAALIVPLVILKIIPVIGPMKKAELRAVNGSLAPANSEAIALKIEDDTAPKNPKIAHFILPLVLLIGATIVLGTDALKGVIVALVFTVGYFVFDRVMTFGKAMDSVFNGFKTMLYACLLYTSPSPRDLSTSRMPSSA